MKKKTGLIVILSLVIALALCGIIAILILDPGRDAVLSKEASRKAAKAADASLRFGYSSENESSVSASDSLHTGSETEIPTEAAIAGGVPSAASENSSAVSVYKTAEAASPKESEAESAGAAADEGALSCIVSVQMPEGLPGTLQVPVSYAEATSEIHQDGYDNSPICAADGSVTTSWQEGVDGPGKGESLTLHYESASPIRYFLFRLGNWRDNVYFYGNNRPRSLILTFEDGSQTTAVFPADQAGYYVELSAPVTTSFVTFTIESVYIGTDWDDTCIAEITAYSGN